MRRSFEAKIFLFLYGILILVHSQISRKLSHSEWIFMKVLESLTKHKYIIQYIKMHELQVLYIDVFFLLLMNGHEPNALAASCQTCISSHIRYQSIFS